MCKYLITYGKYHKWMHATVTAECVGAVCPSSPPVIISRSVLLSEEHLDRDRKCERAPVPASEDASGGGTADLHALSARDSALLS